MIYIHIMIIQGAIKNVYVHFCELRKFLHDRTVTPGMNTNCKKIPAKAEDGERKPPTRRKNNPPYASSGLKKLFNRSRPNYFHIL